MRKPMWVVMFALLAVFTLGMQPSKTLGAFTATLQSTSNSAGYGRLLEQPAPQNSFTQSCEQALLASALDSPLFLYRLGSDEAGTIFDLSHNALNAENAGRRARSSYTNPCPGERLSSLTFGGNQEYLVTDHATTLPTESVSAEMWLSASSPGSLFSFNPAVPNDATRPGMQIEVLPSGVLKYSISSDGMFVDTVTSKTSITDQQWHHVAVVKDAAQEEMAIYVDGVLEGVSPTFQYTATYPGMFRIGCEAAARSDLDMRGKPECFHGDVAWAAAYSRSLSADEIAAHVYARGTGGRL